MSSPTNNAVVETDRIGTLHIFSDGSVLRSPKLSSTPILVDGTVQWKDVQFDSTHNLQLRIFRPTTYPIPTAKLPVIFYLYGGAFIDGSRSWAHFHNYCHLLAAELNTLVVCPDVRFAPENRLPAQIHDALSAIEWVRCECGSDDWLANVADLERVFVVGDSSGGNIAHHLAVRVPPVRVRGYVLLEPFFGGTERTKSEAECRLDVPVNVEVCDKLWGLSLPVGADRDNPLSNPESGAGLEELELEAMMVVVCGLDVLRDRGVEYGGRLRELGKKVEVVEFEGEHHGFFLSEPLSEPAMRLMGVLKRFLVNNGVKD